MKIGTPATVGRMAAVVTGNYGLYHACALRHQQLIDWLKK